MASAAVGSLRGSIRRAALRTAPRSPVVQASFRRAYSNGPGAEQAKGTSPFVWAGVAAAVGGGAYYWLKSGDANPTIAKIEEATGGKGGTRSYQQVYNDIAEILDADEYDDGSFGPVLVRLAWHSSGTYDKDEKTGGSNYATMRFKPESEHGANNGLKIARDLLEEKIKSKYPWISYGDLWTLAGVVAVQEMGGPKIPWRPGRIDGTDKNVTPDGRLPDASQAEDHLRQIFYRMGLNDQEIVALAGAHALGRCHTDRSGFEGPWTFSPTTFTNDFFKLLFDEKWQYKNWKGPKQFEDASTKSLMMLPTDIALIKDKSFRKYAKAYADDQDLFFKDFAAAFGKLIELGVPLEQFASKPPTFLKTTEEQADEKKAAEKK